MQPPTLEFTHTSCTTYDLAIPIPGSAIIPAFYPLHPSCYIIHWSNYELITRPQERFSIFCKTLNLYMPGQRVSQKGSMLVMNQVKRVTLPFFFPIGASAEIS